MRHVYFWSLPSGAEFFHRGKRYEKLSEEKVWDFAEHKSWGFEIQYGCLITEAHFYEYKLTHQAIRPL